MDPTLMGTPAAAADAVPAALVVAQCAPPADDLFADCLDSLDSPRPANLPQPDATTDTRAARRLKRALSLAEPSTVPANPPAPTAQPNPTRSTAPNTALANPLNSAGAPNLTAPPPTAGVLGAASKTSTKATRAPRHPPSSLPPDLPATAQEVTDHASLSRVVTLLSTIIVKAVQDGKSVTASNKRLIVVAAEETRKAMAAFQRLHSTNTENSTCSTGATGTLRPMSTTPSPSDLPATTTLRHDLVDCVREEMAKLKSEIINSVSHVVRPTYAQMLALKGQPPTSPSFHAAKQTAPVASLQ